MKVKRTRANDSIIINNLFTFATIVMVSITIVLYSTFIVEPKKNKEINPLKKIEALPCQKKSNFKVAIKDLDILKKSHVAIQKGYYKININYIKLQKDSLIEKIFPQNELSNYIAKKFNTKPKKEPKEFLEINYEIIEGSSNLDEKNKLNAGTIITTFTINSKEIFFIRSDIKFLYKNAIKDQVDCSIKVYKNYVQN